MGMRTSKVAFVEQITHTKQISMRGDQKLLKRKSVILFFKSHFPPGLWETLLSVFAFSQALLTALFCSGFVSERWYPTYLEGRVLLDW